ncbi:phospholipid-transporting ATPase, partial [Brachionus plicatilis]
MNSEFSTKILIDCNALRKENKLYIIFYLIEFFWIILSTDNVIIPRVSLFPEDFRSYTDVTVDHLESFAKEGFRTLVLAYRTISEEEYEQWNIFQKWNADYLKAALSINGREKKIEECAESIEKNLIVLGVTAIEDKLQEEVPETIRMLLRAGIKMW